MKRIKCFKCGLLMKKCDIPDHLKECSLTEKHHVEAQPENKRSKFSGKESEKNNDDTRGRISPDFTEDEQSTTYPDTSDTIACSYCTKTFTRKDNFYRHQKLCKPEKKTDRKKCKNCHKKFSNYRSRSKHERLCRSTRSRMHVDRASIYSCNQCNTHFSSIQNLLKHEKETKHNSPGASGGSADTSRRTEHSVNNQSSSSSKLNPSQTKCRQCGDMFDDLSQLYKHRMLRHAQTDLSQLQADPWSETQERLPWMNEDESVNEKLRETYHMHRHLILRERIRHGDVRSTYNFPVSNVSNVNQLTEQTEFIFENNRNAFKINLSFGLILQNIDNDTYRYFAPHYTDGLFLFPQLVSNRQDVQRLRIRLAEIDLDNYFKKLKPNSKWRPVIITNVLYVVSKTSFPLGLAQPLPAYITDSKSIVSFENNPKSCTMYTDNLCFFRCLAYHQTKTRYCEKLTLELHSRWLEYSNEKKMKSGDVTLCIMPELEACFEVNINVFELDEEKVVTPKYKSRETFSKETTMFLNLFEDHLSYVSNFKAYASKFRCNMCDKLFNDKWHLDRHSNTCENATKLKFPGGYYATPKTIFEKLSELGVNVDPDIRYFPWFVTFDLEAMLKQVDTQIGSGLAKTQEHVPISASICSNVEHFKEPKFILDSDQDKLVSKMVAHIQSISDKAYEFSKERWANVFSHLDALEHKWSTETVITDLNDDDDDDDDDSGAIESNFNEPPSARFLNAISKDNVYHRFLDNLEACDEIRAQYNDWGVETEDDCTDSDDYSKNDGESTIFPVTSKLMSKLVSRIREQFERYCRQIPVLGFNSAKYDLNLLKTKLAKHLNLHEPKQQKFVVKKENAYVCLSNPTLRFLDMCNYLPPGWSYEKFLKNFGIDQSKGYFPYEYFNDTKILEETSLPPPEAFYSSLKQCNTLEDELRVKYERLLNIDKKTEQEALLILDLECPPPSKIQQRYDQLKETWRIQKMETMYDYLKYYNNLDTLPMVAGVTKYRKYFETKCIDIFKDCISVPGAARLNLFKSGLKNGGQFPLIDRLDEDLYHTIKSNIVGGPSIIFSRYQEIAKTYLRNNQPCGSIVGYDANALYLYCISQPMPCGNYIRRSKQNGFSPVKSGNIYLVMFDWLEWIIHSQGIDIQHKLNSGNEVRIGPYLADGYNSSTNTIFEFFGCYFHSHDCIDRADKQLQKDRFSRMQEKLEFYKDQGFNVEFIWECQFRKQIKGNATLKEFVTNRYPEFYNSHRGKVTETVILQSVIDDKLFGFIEVDIQVPSSWNDVEFKPKTNLSPTEYFKEMCPLFCTTDVPYEAIGEHMQNHVQRFDLSMNPRTLLIGGTKAEKLLLATPLLKWYIEHGLQVTSIHQVVEFGRKSCFKEFEESITRDRRLGDTDKSQGLLAELSKLIGNSAFGGTIINQEKFQTVKYVRGFKKACISVNDPRFRQINELGDSMFEAEFAKAQISINSPVYLGYTILQYAKLHMLSFYYDFLDRFVNRNAFEMVEMDTDSCYFALSAPSLEEAILPEMKQVYESSVYGNCVDDFVGDRFGDCWLVRKCCQKHKQFDSRTPGLMKLDFFGSKFIALCSKSYIGVNEREKGSQSVKYSLKGVNKHFSNPVDMFQTVLNTKVPINAVNRGIRVFDNSMFTYIQPKQAFNYFYCKRIVHSEGIHTSPLSITLKPKNKFKEDEDRFLNSII